MVRLLVQKRFDNPKFYGVIRRIPDIWLIKIVLGQHGFVVCEGVKAGAAVIVAHAGISKAAKGHVICGHMNYHVIHATAAVWKGVNYAALLTLII
jgi:hypothetical protein